MDRNKRYNPGNIRNVHTNGTSKNQGLLPMDGQTTGEDYQEKKQAAKAL